MLVGVASCTVCLYLEQGVHAPILPSSWDVLSLHGPELPCRAQGTTCVPSIHLITSFTCYCLLGPMKLQPLMVEFVKQSLSPGSDTGTTSRLCQDSWNNNPLWLIQSLLPANLSVDCSPSFY